MNSINFQDGQGGVRYGRGSSGLRERMHEQCMVLRGHDRCQYRGCDSCGRVCHRDYQPALSRRPIMDLQTRRYLHGI